MTAMRRGDMTRRCFLSGAAGSLTMRASTGAPLILPVHRVLDKRANPAPKQLSRFIWSIWPEAVRDFNRCGMRFEHSEDMGEIRLSPGDRPLFAGLERGAINLMLTDRLPMAWDRGRALAGASTLWEGHCVCVIALRYAHVHRVPFLSVNTCVHELLHVLLGDVFLSPPNWFQSGGREFRIDWYATRMWLFQDGAAVRKSAQAPNRFGWALKADR